MMTIGWIGLGHMGYPMAMNLIKEGNLLTVYNRTEGKAENLISQGAHRADTPEEVVEKSDITFMMLSDGEAIRAVLTQRNGVLDAVCSGKIIVDMSTISPQESIEFAAIIEEKGGRYIDAPVSGSVGAAIGRQLVVLSAGDQDAVEACRPYFLTLGREMIYFGQTGMGAAAKLTINMLLGIMTQGFGEVLFFGEKMGLSKALVIELISKSAMNNGLFQAKKDMYIAEQFSSAFMLELMSKDLGLAKRASDHIQIELPLAKTANEAFAQAKADGNGKLDMAAIYLDIKKRNSKYSD